MAKKFKISKVEYINKTFRLPKDLIEEISAAANASGVSANEFMIQTAQFALDNLELDHKDGR